MGIVQPLSPTNPHGFSLDQALLLARASAAAYSCHPGEMAACLGASSLRTFARQATYGFVARLAEDLVVAFRGTAPGRLLNWVTNLDFTQAPCGPGNAHRGISESLDLVWPEVRRLVDELATPAGRIWFTWHSLGGALATLAAARLAAPGRVGAYAFGAPRVGCPEFAARYAPPLHRVERAGDPVCHLPPHPGLLALLTPLLGEVLPTSWRALVPAGLSYCHAGYLTRIEEDGSVRPIGREERESTHSELSLPQLLSLFTSGAAAILQRHAIEGYVAALAAPAARGGRPEDPAISAFLQKIRDW
jgi:hypothetical protein